MILLYRCRETHVGCPAGRSLRPDSDSGSVTSRPARGTTVEPGRLRVTRAGPTARRPGGHSGAAPPLSNPVAEFRARPARLSHCQALLSSRLGLGPAEAVKAFNLKVLSVKCPAGAPHSGCSVKAFKDLLPSAGRGRAGPGTHWQAGLHCPSLSRR
jgi:hypothetical protein